MKKCDYIVLGAGLAGLSFAYRISKAGFSVLLLEKEDQIGGLSRTFEHKEFKFDLCAHRFHTTNEKLLKEIKQLPGLSLSEHAQKSRILIFNKYLKYPFELQNLFRAMNPIESMHSGLSFLYNRFHKTIKEDKIKSYKDWFVHHFGHKLYTIMCYPYTSKIWRTDPSNISADWAGQRFQGVKIRALLKKVISKLIKLDFSSYSLKDEELAPDGGKFYYAATGIQEIPDAFKKEVLRYGSEILTNTEPKKIFENKLEIEYKINNEMHIAKADKAIITTIPLHASYDLLHKKNQKTEQCLKELKYMDIIFVYLFLNKERMSNDHWLYFSNSNIIFNRAVEFKNWSSKMAPLAQTSVCFDITCFKGDKTWNKSDQQLVKECTQSVIDARLLKGDEIFDYKVIRTTNAYPFYDLGYKEKLKNIVRYIERDNNIFCLGRTGIFRYNNADNSIEMGFELAKRLLANKRTSMLDYTIKKNDY